MQNGPQDNQELLARMKDLAKLCQKRNRPMFSHFLTPAEQAFLKQNRELTHLASLTFDGGYPGAERAMAVLTPLDYEPDEYVWQDDTKAPIAILAVNYKGDALTHRDILGACMGLGIKRETIGDILEQTTPQVLFCHQSISEYIQQNLLKAGRANVSCIPSDLPEIPEQEVKTITVTVASLRLDSVLAEGFSLSRDKANQAVKQGIVSVNWLPVTSPSKEVKEGDFITCRGLGKIKLSVVSGQSKKGRTFIEIQQY